MKDYATVGDLINRLKDFNADLIFTIGNETYSKEELQKEIKLNTEYYDGDAASPYYDKSLDFTVVSISG